MLDDNGHRKGQKSGIWVKFYMYLYLWGNATVNHVVKFIYSLLYGVWLGVRIPCIASTSSRSVDR